MKSEPLNIHNKTFLINRTIQQAPTGTLVREFFKNAEESAAHAEDGNRRINITCEDPAEGGNSENDSAKEGRNRRAQPKKVRLAPEGARASLAARALERAPDVKMLIDPEQIADKLLKGRAGRFYKDTQELFINGLYPAVERMSAELEREFAGVADPDEIRSAAVRAARKSMAFRVGKVVCFALSKRLADDWSVDDLDRATSPESLSMAADDYRQSTSISKKMVKQLLKLGQVEEAAVS